MIAVVVAVLFTTALTAPISILAWEHRRRARTHARFLLRRRPRSRTLPRASLHIIRTGSHATPRRGTPIPTPAQIREAAA